MKARNLAISAALGWLSLAGATALAEGLEEIVVTAQRTAQSLQDVPISISVVSAEDLMRNRIFDFAETADLTPGVSMNSSAASLASITVRGVGPSFFAPTAQSVPLFVDEVPASQPGAVINTLFDVERVELLRGPQGTLYGKNAPSGAYNITTVRPDASAFSGSVSGAVYQWDANNEPGLDLRTALNIPITDTLAARVAAVYAETDGGTDMKHPMAQESVTGGKDHRSLRMRLLWQPDEVTQVHLISNIQSLDDSYSWRLFDGLVPATGGSNPVPALFTNFSDREDYGALRSQATTDVHDVALKYGWDGELTNVDMILSYQTFETTLFQNQTPWPREDPGSTDFELETKQATLELRVSDSGDFLDYVAGVFVSDNDSKATTIVNLDAFIPAVVDEETFGAAVFGNFTFHLAKQWDFSAGMRYEDNSQGYVSDVQVVGFAGDIDEQLDFNHLSWSLKLKYFANENTTAYLALDNAYRQGGINSYIPAIDAVGEALGNEAIAATSQAFLEYDEEVSTALEFGLKGNLFDNRMRYSLAVFYQEFDDHIIRQNAAQADSEIGALGALYTLVFVNAEDVVTKGFELDVAYALTDNLTIDFRSAYFDATVEEWVNRLCTSGDDDSNGVFCPAESGSELANAPKLNTNTQLTYFGRLDSGWNYFANLAWVWRSESAMNSNITSRYDDPENLLNLTVGFNQGPLSFTVWGKNLTDELTIQTPDEVANGDPALPPALVVAPNAGRQFGLTFGYNF